MSKIEYIVLDNGRRRVTGWKDLSPKEKARRIKLATGLVGKMTLNAISLKCGVSDKVLRNLFIPGWREKESARKKARVLPSIRVRLKGGSSPGKELVAARMAEVPEDTRTVTQQLFGDPVFERSALYRLRAEGR